MTLLTRVFFTRKCMAVLLCGQRKEAVITRWPYYRGLRKAGFHCIAESIIILLLNCGASIFYSIFNFLCYVIWWLYPPTKPINFPKIAPAPLENNNSLKIFGAYFPSHLQTWHQMKNDPPEYVLVNTTHPALLTKQRRGEDPLHWRKWNCCPGLLADGILEP